MDWKQVRNSVASLYACLEDLPGEEEEEEAVAVEEEGQNGEEEEYCFQDVDEDPEEPGN